MTMAAALTHIFVAKILCNVYDFKFLGIAIATSIHFVVRAFVGTVMVRYNNQFRKSIIPLFSSESFKGMKEIFKLGFYSVMLKVMGWWAFDVFTILAT